MKPILCCLLLIIFSCISKNKELSISHNNSQENLLEININDTLRIGKNEGNIEISNFLNDTTKFDLKDERVVFVYLNIFDKDSDLMQIDKSKCDSFSINSNIVNQKINCPIFVIPKKLGNFKIMGIVEDYIFLHSYTDQIDSTKIRMIKNDYYFEKNVLLTSVIKSKKK